TRARASSALASCCSVRGALVKCQRSRQTVRARVKLLAIERAAATPKIGFARCTQASKQVGERSWWSLGGFRARSTRTPILLDNPREQDFGALRVARELRGACASSVACVNPHSPRHRADWSGDERNEIEPQRRVVKSA